MSVWGRRWGVEESMKLSHLKRKLKAKQKEKLQLTRKKHLKNNKRMHKQSADEEFHFSDGTQDK